jgi:hypothetical protein
MIAGLLQALPYLMGLLQDKKVTLLRLKEMIVGKKSEKGKEVRRKMVKQRMIRRVGDKNRKRIVPL